MGDDAPTHLAAAAAAAVAATDQRFQKLIL